MERYVAIVAGLNFVVDILLLAAVCKWQGAAYSWLRLIAAAMLGGVYGGASLLPDFHFLGNGIWRLVCLAVMSMTAFGMELPTLRKGALFSVLWLAMNSLASGFMENDLWTALLWGALLALLCLLGFDGGDGKSYVPVTIRHNDRIAHITALRDTGNLLRDPVSGQSVLIVDPYVAQKILGLNKEHLADPIATLAQESIPGLRLIPYSSLGQPGGMLLAMRFADVVIGEERGPHIVAFAPHAIGEGRGFEALAGGMA